jgi:hypothetical protein
MTWFDILIINHRLFLIFLKLICLIDVPLNLQLKINDWCRLNGKLFISAQSPGLLGIVGLLYHHIFQVSVLFLNFTIQLSLHIVYHLIYSLGYIFCDFGNHFETSDPFGTVLKGIIYIYIYIINYILFILIFT